MSRIEQTSIKGTFNYMPPEAFGEEPVGPAIDVWGLACVITEMHTLKAPWEGVQMQRIMRAVCDERRVPEVPDAAPAATMLRQCFAYTPAARPSPGQMFEAFVDLQESGQREAQGEAARLAAAM